MPDQLISEVILLLFVVDPFGNVPAVNTMLANVAPARRRAIVLRECVIAFGMLLLFMAFGRQFLSIMHLTPSSVSIAGGVILLMISIRMVFPTAEGIFGAQPAGERLQRALGDPVMQAIGRLMGLVLTALAVEMLLDGIRAFVEGFR